MNKPDLTSLWCKQFGAFLTTDFGRRLRLEAARPVLAVSIIGIHCVKRDSVDERVLVYRPGMRGTLTQCLAVELACESDILLGDRREWETLDGVDLNLAEPDPVTAAALNPWPLPQSHRKRDIPAQDVVAQLAAEFHTATLASGRVAVAGGG